MRIIEHGSLSNKIKQFSCEYCGCIFEANYNEYDYMDLGFGGLTPICRCPECKQQTTKEIDYSSIGQEIFGL